MSTAQFAVSLLKVCFKSTFSCSSRIFSLVPNMATQEPSNQILQSLDEHLLHVAPNEEIMQMLTQNNNTNSQDNSTASTSSLIHSATDDPVVEEEDRNNLSHKSQKSLQVQLIEEVRKFPCIWEVSSRAHKEKTMKLEAWRRISAAL